MSRLTRRGLFGAGAASLAAACATTGTGAPKYEGTVAFKHGVASGDPTQDAVILWTRATPTTDGPVPVNWAISPKGNSRDIIQSGYMVTGPERDYTVKVDVTGLEPGKEYSYWFWTGQTVSGAGVTRTLPATGLDDFRMAVVSCSNWPFGFFNVYREIAERNNVHAVIHLGDYIYEYGVNGYGGEIGKRLGRNHEPSHECLTLADYRTRYAQYRSDPDLQVAHAIAPWFCTWDDHESANNSYRSGAGNHQPETEGDWTARKAQAVQAYLEWIPVRDPVPGRPRDAVFHKVDIGDLATLFLLESRLIGRSDEITYGEIGLAAPEDRARVAAEVKAKIEDPSRTMLGMEQEQWLAEALAESTRSGRRWQVLGNQVTMAKVTNPDLEKGLSADQWAQVPPGSRRWYESGKYGLEWNPDAWAGFPAARERLYASARSAGARIVTLTGDTHTAWGNDLHDKDGYLVGVEFGCTSVSSNGAGDSLPLEELNWLMTEANDEVVYYNAFGRGFTLLTLSADRVEGEFVRVSTVRTPEYYASTDAVLVASRSETGMRGLVRQKATREVVAG
ncbi:MAG: alkaline phosphatase D family protein [Hyphomonadaceae bacterium]